MSYEPVIGLEVHAQLLTRSKLFCSCSARFGSEPNKNTCPVCLALPGVLPVLNRQAVEFAIRMGLATNCRITGKNVFARKNYFYPDLPKGYQISQYENPICVGGYIEIPSTSPEGTLRGRLDPALPVEGLRLSEPIGSERATRAPKKIGLTRIHIEEDAGKLLHEHPQTRSRTASWVDLNRAGVPLIEIVSEPDIHSPAEAAAYLKEIRRLVMYLEVCDGNMEEGSLRCDANISVRPVGEKKFGTKVEIKNMNSFRHIEKALHYEIKRQTEVLEGKRSQDRIIQETRLWDPEKELTQPMRSKEEAHDYRYFPDPDLLPVEIHGTWLSRVREALPELPEGKRDRFAREYQLPLSQIDILTDSRQLADFFEMCIKIYSQPKPLANWIINEFLRMIQGDPSRIQASRLKPEAIGKTLQLVDQGKISGGMAKTVLQKVFETGEAPETIIRKDGLSQVSDEGSLTAIVDEIFNENPKEVDRYRRGEEKLLSFFLGQIMKKTGGRANPPLAKSVFEKKIKS